MPNIPCSYHGKRSGSPLNDTITVTVKFADGVQRPLSPRFDLANHSPTGFEWGYGGSGPAQLALAILAHALQDDARAKQLYQRFKFARVAGFAKEGWAMTEAEVLAWVAKEESLPVNGPFRID